MFFTRPIILFAASSIAFLTIPTQTPSPYLRIRETTAISTVSASVPTGTFTTTEHIIIPGYTNAVNTVPQRTLDIVYPTCIQTIVPDKNGYVPPGTCGALYNYYPSFVAAVIASCVFGMLTIAHIIQATLYKKRFCWVVIMGTLWEFFAFVARAVSTKFQQSAGIELVAEIFVLLAPLWINAFAYMNLARMVQYFHPAHSILRIPASILSVGFVCLDFVSFAIQLVGGSWAGPTAPLDQQMKGVHIYMGGIGLQQVFIFLFLGLAIRFHRELATLYDLRVGKEGWQSLLWTLYASLAFITIRIFYRLTEFSGGKTSSNPLPYHESYFYVLEAMPMIFAILVFNVTHPGRILVGPDAELPGLWSMVKAGFARGHLYGKGKRKVEDDDYKELL